jgi:RNA polymerase sigma-70 factor, ECF subfamily
VPTLPSPPDVPRSELGDSDGGGPRASPNPPGHARGAGAGADELDDDLGIPSVGRAFGRPVNRSAADASNREARQREAEEDRELITLARKGDQTAFRRLVERHQQRAFTLAIALVRDENDARELVQEAFLRVHRGLETFQGGSSFYTWLYRIITNLAIDLKRKPGRRQVEFDEHHADPGELALVSRIDGADPLDVMRRREIAERIRSALDALPVIHRSVILMREVEGMSYEEMAQAAGVSKGTIMSRLFHARQKLQRALADCYAEDGRGARSGAGKPEEVS